MLKLVTDTKETPSKGTYEVFPTVTDALRKLPIFSRLEKETSKVMNSFEDDVISAMGSVLDLIEHSDEKWIPVININDEPTRYTVRVELPGIPKDNLKIEFKGEQLIISGNKPVSNVKVGTLLREECYNGDFTRKIQLSRNINTNTINATLRDGILTLLIEKLIEQTAQITIN